MKRILTTNDMKLIKIGDWLCNPVIFRGVNEKGEIYGLQNVWLVMGKDKGKKKLKAYLISHHNNKDEIDIYSGLPKEDKELFLFDEKERIRLNKLLILKGLEDESRM